MEDIERVIAKIKKCLALGQSSNPHESALALKQAQALMVKHNIDATTLALSEISDVSVAERSVNRRQPPRHELLLVSTIGKAFGCGMVMRSGACRDRAQYIFIGSTANAEVAAYSAAVLIRQFRTACKAHVNELASEAKTEGWRLSRKEANSASYAFGCGWVLEVSKQVRDFAQADAIQQAIAERIRECAGRRQVRARSASLSPADRGSYESGSREGAQVRLHRPMEQESQMPRLSPRCK